MNKSKAFLLVALVILFSTFLAGKDSFAKDGSDKGIPSQIEDLQKQINTLSTMVSEQQQLLKDLTTNHNQEITLLNEKIQNQSTEINTLSTKVTEQEKTLSQLETSSKEQDDNIKNISSQLASLNEYITQFISVQFNTFKTTIETQINQILKDISDLKNNPPSENQKYKVTGRLLDSEGKAFYTYFYLMDEKNNTFPSFGTQNGEYYIPDLPNGKYKIRFWIEPYQSLLISEDEIVISGSNIEELELKISEPTFTASGVALGSNGSPLGNQRIHIFDPNNTGWGGYIEGGRPKTDSDGSFSVTGLPNGTYRFNVGYDWKNPLATGVITINNGNAEGIILKGTEETGTGYTVTGKAQFKNNQALSFAKIYVINQNGLMAQFQTGWHGDFTLSNLPNGEYVIKFGSMENPLIEQSININGQNQSGLILTSNAPLYDVSGNMYDVNGKEIYAGIILVDKNTGVTYSEYPRNYQSYHFQVPNGTYEIRYHVPGFDVSTPTEFVVNGENINEDIHLSVPTYSIKGKAIDKDGNPLARQPISMGYGNGGSFGYNFMTDENGNFEIDSLVDGQYIIKIGNFDNPRATKPITISGSDLTDLVVSE
ncbi:hypothetical protein [Neobacillus sp. D3-1R]|uniref:hypothetical protein n=1 Tax=Neobacillus sp. D3-1R TaxID=3445778 RepID=UPI003F9F260C